MFVIALFKTQALENHFCAIYGKTVYATFRPEFIVQGNDLATAAKRKTQKCGKRFDIDVVFNRPGTTCVKYFRSYFIYQSVRANSR